MADYLALRRSLAGVVLMVDARRGFTDLDRQLLQWLERRVVTGQVKLLVLLTKADKLSRRDGQTALEQAQQELSVLAGEQADIGVTLFSALSGLGVADVAIALREWVPTATGSTAAPAQPQPG